MTTEPTRLTLLGAGGKMGCRIADNLRGRPDYDVRYVEPSEEGRARLAERGLFTTPESEALSGCEVVVLAVPDRLIGSITAGIVHELDPDTLIVSLDPAAAHAGVIPLRDDLAYFVTHPCHPPLFNDETAPEAMTDWFGGIHAKQHIVCALHSGREDEYARGERIARAIYAPVMESFRLTVEQMALLEPALAETFAATLVCAMKEALDEVVAMGVPERAAREFLLGHLRIEAAIVFGFAGFPFSDGAKLAIDQAYEKIFRPDWKERILDLEALRESVGNITGKPARVGVGG